MFSNLTTNELIVLLCIMPFLICLVIAFLNFDWLNNSINNFFNLIDKKYEGTSNWFWKPFFGILRFPVLISASIKHQGWKNGVSVAVGTFSFAVLIALLSVAAYIAFIIAIIALILYIIFAILSK